MNILFVITLYSLGSVLGSNEFRLGSPGGLAITAWPPAPTIGPGAIDLRRAIDRRQGGAVTCGWVSGRANQPFTCNAGSACVFNTKYEVFGCCAGDLSTCDMQTSCFQSSYASQYTANGYTRGCTDSVNAHCIQYDLGFYSSYGCGTSGTDVELESTILGDSITAIGITTGFFPAIVSTSGNVVVGASGAVVTTLPPAASASAGGAVSAVNGAQPTSSGGSSGSSSSSTSNNFNNNANASITGTNLSTGAIVGIAVGAGVLIIALVVISILVRRHRTKQPTFVPGHGYGNQGYGPNQYGSPPSYPGSSMPGAGNLPPKQPPVMTQSNLDTHLQQQADEWAFAQGGTPQRQTAAKPEDDGIRMSEILPEEAVDERRRQEMMRPMSDVGQTAVAPTSISHHVQGV